MDKSSSLFGQALVDFVNAKTTDEECHSYFENIHKIVDYPNFIDGI